MPLTCGGRIGHLTILMALARTMLAFLVAVSVALLPVPGKSAFVWQPQELTATTMAEPMDGCCPHPAQPCDKGPAGCAGMVACALNCPGYISAVSSSLVYAPLISGVMPFFESGAFYPEATSPPFRPPRY